MTSPVVQLIQPADIQIDGIIWHWGRPLRVVKVMGRGKRAPVILEELVAGADWDAGQLTLWAADEVRRRQRAGVAA